MKEQAMTDREKQRRSPVRKSSVANAIQGAYDAGLDRAEVRISASGAIVLVTREKDASHGPA